MRQLRYILEGAAALSRDGEIDAADLHLPDGAAADSATRCRLKLEELEAWAIRRALDQTGGNNTRAAEVLGIHRDTLIEKIRKIRIDRPAERLRRENPGGGLAEPREMGEAATAG